MLDTFHLTTGCYWLFFMIPATSDAISLEYFSLNMVMSRLELSMSTLATNKEIPHCGVWNYNETMQIRICFLQTCGHLFLAFCLY